MCGEQLSVRFAISSARGSPPRVRGTGRLREILKDLPRITPACAGNSISVPTIITLHRDHPRVCGDQPRASRFFNCWKGSPPRVRGTDAHLVTTQPLKRITPACAGNSFMKRLARPLKRDHPRVCGEQVNLGHHIGPQEGSPPRVRGTADEAVEMVMERRITPACAGNSTTPGIYSLNRKDHPRVCGEQRKTAPSRPIRKGSPPRVRGTARGVTVCDCQGRITPACAGNRPS